MCVNRCATLRIESGLPLGSGMLNRNVMAEPSERIEAALARIEAAAAARAYENERLSHRHEALREKIQDAVYALDALIAREAEGAS